MSDTQERCPTCGSVYQQFRAKSHCEMTCPPEKWRWIKDERLNATNIIECDDLWHEGSTVVERPTATELSALRQERDMWKLRAEQWQKNAGNYIEKIFSENALYRERCAQQSGRTGAEPAPGVVDENGVCVTSANLWQCPTCASSEQLIRTLGEALRRSRNRVHRAYDSPETLREICDMIDADCMAALAIYSKWEQERNSES